MVKVKDHLPLSADGSIDIEQWLSHVVKKGYGDERPLLRNACVLSQLASHDHATETGESCLQQGLAMADVLLDLGVDEETLAAAILYVCVHDAELSLDDVTEQFGAVIAKLVSGVQKMSSVTWLNHETQPSHHQINNVRKMLLAMVDDVRIVLIKLADRLCVLRSVAPLSSAMREGMAKEVMAIYAPLAHRLGVGAMKWELEDLAFRYLHPMEYSAIAKSLNVTRRDRDRYVHMIVDELNTYLQASDIQHVQVSGRSKHIHSIYRKMSRKNVSIDQIFDAMAVRILVDTQEQCYDVLSIIDTLWRQVRGEFDDYIVHPKSNGYQSLHTAVEGPEGRIFEVQIRTVAMHQQAERGVAAHWKYKEGGKHTQTSHERKIEWLRDVLAWQRDVLKNDKKQDIFMDDRVYVFTPKAEILELPQGATALDFAYHIHSDLGHRCRGVKVNSRMVPLTYVLKTTDTIDVLTGKESKPSRDWMNPHLHYLKSSRARAKVLHWFKTQDHEKNCAEGHDLLDKELKALHIKYDRLNDILDNFHFKTVDDLYAALGRGDIKLGSILNRLLPVEKSEVLTVKPAPQQRVMRADLQIEGVGQLLTHMARCCQPLPGDEVIGYITLGRGIAVHRSDCPNILHAHEKQRARFVNVNWGSTTNNTYAVDLSLKALDRPTLLRDVTAVMAHEKIHVLALQTRTDRQDQLMYIDMRVDIDGLHKLSHILTQLRHISDVLDVRRQVMM